MKIYLDTNIIRDYMENRNPSSTELVECVRQKGFECFTSTFSMMELADLQKDTFFFVKTVVNKKWDVDKFLRSRKQKELGEDSYKDLDEYLNTTTSRLPFIKFANLSGDGWRVAKIIASHSSLSAVDTIHLATAYTAGCNLLITNDTQFVKEGNKILEKGSRKKDIIVVQPEEALKKLAS